MLLHLLKTVPLYDSLQYNYFLFLSRAAPETYEVPGLGVKSEL